jgi:hypothetical protein
MTNLTHKFLIYLFISALAILAQALTTYPETWTTAEVCTPASEDGLKESPKRVRQK